MVCGYQSHAITVVLQGKNIITKDLRYVMKSCETFACTNSCFILSDTFENCFIAGVMFGTLIRSLLVFFAFRVLQFFR